MRAHGDELPQLPGLRPVLSVVVPAYNEAEVLPVFHARLQAVIAEGGVRSLGIPVAQADLEDRTPRRKDVPS